MTTVALLLNAMDLNLRPLDHRRDRRSQHFEESGTKLTRPVLTTATPEADHPASPSANTDSTGRWLAGAALA